MKKFDKKHVKKNYKMKLKSSKLDSYGKFKIEEQRKFKNNVWTSYPIIKDIKEYIKAKNYEFKTALDPCAGSGRLIEEFKNYSWTGYEINEQIVNECIENEEVKQHITIDDFLTVDIIDRYDVCVCNPPYNKNGGINKWIKKILSCCDMLFLIVPYNFITKIKQQRNLIDCINTENGMDETYNSAIKVFVFSSEEQETGFYENPANALFYLPNIIKEGENLQLYYLRDYIQPINQKITIKKKKINEIPDGKTYPVYTVANNPVKYTDINPNCPDSVVLLNHSYLTSSNALKYSDTKCYLNETFRIYTVKEDMKEEFLNLLSTINIYLLNLFKSNNINVILTEQDILNIPLYINIDDKNKFLNEKFEEHIKRFKFYKNIKNYSIEWN